MFMSANKRRLEALSETSDNAQGITVKPFSTGLNTPTRGKPAFNVSEDPYNLNNATKKSNNGLFSDHGRIFAPKREIKEPTEFDLRRKENY
jgi:hypothetical protein